MWQKVAAVLAAGAVGVAALGGEARATSENPDAVVPAPVPPPPAAPGYWAQPQVPGAPPYWVPTGRGLQLRAKEPDVVFFVKTAQKTVWGPHSEYGAGLNLMGLRVSSFQALCGAPCAVQLPPGDYVFALTEGPSRLLESQAVTLRGDETVTGTWVSRRALRYTFQLVGVVSALAGFVVFQQGATAHPLAWGVGLSLGGGALMLASLSQKDRAEIEVRP